MHTVLRSATEDVHERLHLHSGLKAVQDETIDINRYTALICRLYGFYLPFEVAAQLIPERTGWLASDLTSLNVNTQKLAAIPICRAFPKFTPQQILGALYVVEGSALGGRGLARRLDRILGAGVMDGRRFFSGYGADTGVAWREFLTRLTRAEPRDHPSIIDAAKATFETFEEWLNGWDTAIQN
ncbi:MAG: biliverdin-producing heme oxygenase [Chitinophagales bacterium]|nr:biliverdin-producing heme oxygenase [Hyphomicrobiales bacterium]